MNEIVLGLDVGEARIGVARGETGSRLAFPRGALRRGRQGDDVREVTALARSEGATRIVVGLPRRTDGRDSAQTQRVRAFATALHAAGLSVTFEDERYTTAIAERRLATSSLPAGKRQDKGRVDEAAAVLILESWLASRAAGEPEPEP
ncbi:MAG: Holliday junction resolvase RuvX [Trueperaceae bacterium]|nr:Holliday junction resolvase RuvX [Trueperaceae bacterium]